MVCVAEQAAGLRIRRIWNNVLPVDSKLQPGTVAAFIVGSLAVILGGRASDVVTAFLSEPGIVVIGLSVAAGLGSGLGVRVPQRPLVDAIGVAIAYGALVPVIVAVVIAFPVAPLAALVAIAAWPVTIPTALVWLALIRWDRSRVRLSTVAPAATAVVLSTALLFIRFTQPATTMSAEAGQCLTFPGESIRTIAWSPDGEWLGIGSEADGGGIVRVIDQDSNEISELARGPFVEAASGVAVGPGGETTYLVHVPGVTHTEDEGARLWQASPAESARPFADLPTPGVFGLTWTPDGIAAVQGVDPTTWTETHRIVWVRPRKSPIDTFEPIPSERQLDYPVLAPLVDPSLNAPMTVRTPTGKRTIRWPLDASVDGSISTAGTFLVFHAFALTADEVDEAYSQIVAQSTETGQRIVLLEREGRSPMLAAGRLAYLTPDYPDNTVCVKAMTM